MDHTKKFVLVDPIAYSRIQAPTNTESIVPNKVSQLDNEIREILNGDEPDDIKVKRYGMLLKKFRVNEPIKSSVHDMNVVDEEEILESVPSAVRYKAKRLVRIIKENPLLAWNARGELVWKQSVVSGSNIVDLFNDLLKQKRSGDDRPHGWQEFSEALAECRDVGRDLISNYTSWKVISARRRPATSVVRAEPLEGSSRKSRSRERSTGHRARVRRVSWEEY